ncbi:hypothetical protein L6R50_08905 [Myxococcota bacterium]|nr:hypothetical protein [Myxococcota bacterium]
MKAPGVDIDLVVPRLSALHAVAVRRMLGRTVLDLVRPALREEPTTREGGARQVFPLRVPDGMGFAIPLGVFGEIGLRADGDRLVLAVPRMLYERVVGRVRHLVVAGPLSPPGRGDVSEAWLQLRPGDRVTAPLLPGVEVVLEVPAGAP